jgi:hypothetical protein
MTPSARARVAAVIGAAFHAKRVSSVYDYSMGGHRSMTAEVRAGTVAGYDYSTSTHFSGSGTGLDFYDYETSTHVQLKLEGTQFSGYDYHSGRHFSGSINGSPVSLYDYETSQHNNYTV